MLSPKIKIKIKPDNHLVDLEATVSHLDQHVIAYL